MSNVERFPLTRVINGTRYFWFQIVGIPQFNQGQSSYLKSTSYDKVIKYVKTHDINQTALIIQLTTEHYMFGPGGIIMPVQNQDDYIQAEEV